MIQGKYVGPREDLKGETAQLREADMTGFRDDITQRYWLAQFDNMERFATNERDLCFGWHRFAYNDFEVIQESEA